MLARRRSFKPSLLKDPPPVAEKFTEDPVTQKTANSTVTCVYQANIADYWRNVSLLWTKNIINHSLCITIHGLAGSFHTNCKIDVKPWSFWSKKGSKSVEVDGNRVEVYWDFRATKFSGSPEPRSDYYVALVCNEEIVLLLGDYKKKAYKKMKCRPALVEAALLYKKENVFATKSFTTRGKLDDRGKECDIIVWSSTSSGRDPEMWISIDGIVVVQVNNLEWKFRGNQTVYVNEQPVQVFWDVYDWLFGSPGVGHGLFIFKTGGPDCESDRDGSNYDCGESDSCSDYSSARSNSKALESWLFLYAWKIE